MTFVWVADGLSLAHSALFVLREVWDPLDSQAQRRRYLPRHYRFAHALSVACRKY